MYVNDPEFDNTHYTFLKLGHHKLKYNSDKGYKIINEQDYPFFLDLPHYAELTGLYCIYKNKLYQDLDYIGFSHYDKEHRLIGDGTHNHIKQLELLRLEAEYKQRIIPSSKTNLTELIKAEMAMQKDILISLESHDAQKIYDQNVVMDEDNPDMFVGDGINSIDRILYDYNLFFGTEYTWHDLKKCNYITMCDCFVAPVWLFEKMMTFICPIIESGILDRFDTKRKHRLQGGLLERYVAVFFALENIEKVDLSTVHQYWRKKKSFLKNIFNLITGK